MKKLCLLLVLILLCGTFTVGCSEQEEPLSYEEESAVKRIQIGFTFDTFVLERWIRDRDMFVSTAKGLGAEVDVRNANGDVGKQIQQMEEFISQKKDVIVIVAVDCYALRDVVDKARSAGIRIISYDRLIQNAKSDLYITVDNELVGRQMAEVVKEKLPDGGNVVMICGPEIDTNSKTVAEGFEKSLEGTGLKIVNKISVKAWTPEYGFQAASEALQDYSNIDAVMCGNDGLAGYAIQALSEHQLAGKVVVTGQDADLEACQRIMEGTQTLMVYKPVETLAEKAAEFAVKLAKGEELTGVKGVMTNETGKIPYCGLEPIAVTADNMEQVIIESAFHLREDVYRNVTEVQ